MKNYYIVIISILCFFIFFAGTLDLNLLFNYSNQAIPGYINVDNTPGSNPITDEAATLGRVLFYDTNLSLTNTVSCASCHKPEFAFADDKAFSIGVNDSIGSRNTPSVMNMLSRPYYFYDGRSATLEEQAIIPIENPNEMNLSYEIAVQRVQNQRGYDSLFQIIYKEKPDSSNIANALSEFQRSLESDGSAANDLWINEIDTSALSISQKRGREIFLSDKFKCFDCHFGPDFTGDEFRNIGLYDGTTLKDKGRYEITQDSSDLGKFKVPGLRNVVLTGPYMHNGMFETLEEVIDYYSNPYDFVKNPINIDTLMVEPLNFTSQQKSDLVDFLHTLTDQQIPLVDLTTNSLKN